MDQLSRKHCVRFNLAYMFQINECLKYWPNIHAYMYPISLESYLESDKHWILFNFTVIKAVIFLIVIYRTGPVYYKS